MKNVCIVGYGAIGPVHADGISKCENARFYAVCDVEPIAIKKCLQKHNVIVYTDYDEMLCDKNIDSVHICTPHYLHFEMIEKALNAGKTVVCEKPVVMTEQEFQKLMYLPQNDRICVVFQNRLNPSVVKLKQLCDSGELGEIKTVRGILTWDRDDEYYAQDEWRGKLSTEGGGVLINQAIHTLDYFSLLPVRVASVRANIANFTIPSIEVEDTATVSLKLENGAKCVFYATNSYGVNSSPFFEIVFERGVLRYIDNKLYLNGELIEEDSNGFLGKDYWGRGHEKLISDFYDNNKYFSVSQVKQTMQTLFAVYKSAELGGKEISL